MDILFRDIFADQKRIAQPVTHAVESNRRLIGIPPEKTRATNVVPTVGIRARKARSGAHLIVARDAFVAGRRRLNGPAIRATTKPVGIGVDLLRWIGGTFEDGNWCFQGIEALWIQSTLRRTPSAHQIPARIDRTRPAAQVCGKTLTIQPLPLRVAVGFGPSAWGPMPMGT